MNEIIKYVATRFTDDGVPLVLYPGDIQLLYTKPTKMDNHAYMLLNEALLDEILTITSIDIREFCEWMTMRVLAELLHHNQPQKVIDSEFDKLIDQDQRDAASAIPALTHYLPKE